MSGLPIVQVRKVSDEALVQGGPFSVKGNLILEEAARVPDPWFYRSPRGGLHIAIKPYTVHVRQTDEDWMRNLRSVMVRSAGSRYLRPGTALHRQALGRTGQ